jgi:hypothetical protein
MRFFHNIPGFYFSLKGRLKNVKTSLTKDFQALNFFWPKLFAHQKPFLAITFQKSKLEPRGLFSFFKNDRPQASPV